MAKQNAAKVAFRFVLIVGIVNFHVCEDLRRSAKYCRTFSWLTRCQRRNRGFCCRIRCWLRAQVCLGIPRRQNTQILGGHICRIRDQYVGRTGPGACRETGLLQPHWSSPSGRDARSGDPPWKRCSLTRENPSAKAGCFGLNEALDQTGATLGPLITAFVLYRHGGYRHAFAVLLISALLCLAVLFIAWFLHRRPHEMEESAQPSSSRRFSRAYWLYLVTGGLIAAGFADFSLIAFHFQKTATVPQGLVPVFYAVAMATGALASLVLGKLLDKLGLPILLVAFGVPAFFAPLVFVRGATLELVGMILWGIGMGAQDSCLKAVLSAVVPPERRSTAFGIFDTGFGLAWFVGSAIMGLLYDKSIPALVAFSVALQILALPVLAFGKKEEASK